MRAEQAAGLLWARCFSKDRAVSSCWRVLFASAVGSITDVLCMPMLLSESDAASSTKSRTLGLLPPALQTFVVVMQF